MERLISLVQKRCNNFPGRVMRKRPDFSLVQKRCNNFRGATNEKKGPECESGPGYDAEMSFLHAMGQCDFQHACFSLGTGVGGIIQKGCIGMLIGKTEEDGIGIRVAIISETKVGGSRSRFLIVQPQIKPPRHSTGFIVGVGPYADGG